MKYFTELKLSGYKSIKDVTLKLNPGINILIGPNGSGKSNLLEFINKLDGLIPDLYSDFSIDYTWLSNESRYSCVVSQLFLPNKDYKADVLGLGATASLEKAGLFFSRRIDYLLTRNSEYVAKESGQSIGSVDILHKINREYWGDLIQRITYIKFPESGQIEFLSYPQNVKLDPDEISPLLNINNESPFHYLLGVALFEQHIYSHSSLAFVSRFAELLGPYMYYFKTYSPIEDIKLSSALSISESSAENIQINFKVYSRWSTWDELSDGTQRLVRIIFGVINAHGPILLEEPELGIHPHQLHQLLQFLKESGEEKQIILSTHSPDVLDVLRLDQLESINIVSNGEDGTKVKKLNVDQIEKANAYFEEFGTIGDYWKHSDLE